ncbi:ABC transporter ATP-binding protein [Verrucomicrobiota bacterium]|nr:ABC transporter ATP-binding protein [Verrucomicrobiota bacterium]
MLTIGGLSKSYGGRVLFEDVTLQVNRGDRIGLVGPNGAGKTTMLRLILGDETPDDGTITFQRGTSIGYLPQESAPIGDETVVELASSVSAELVRVMREMRLLAAAGDEDSGEAHEAASRFDELDGSTIQAKAKQMLNGLGFRDSDFDRRAAELSGGWVMRAHLARLLTQEPDLLILDEPTNHLDLEALLWFQDYLKYYPGAILMISHDREFLNQLVDGILEIRQSKLTRYRGTYDDYLVQKEAAEQQLLAAYKNQQRDIARLQEFADRFGAKASKASQAQSKLKQIERMEKIEAPASEAKKVSFNFPQPQRSGQRAIRLTDIHHAYGEKVVYAGVSLEVEREKRIVLVGPNGAGKSTLLKILAGVLPVQQGVRELGHNTKTGYYSQYRVEMLQPQRTVLEEALDTPQRITEQEIRTVLGCFLFSGDSVFKKISVLSGGEKSRLALVKLLLDPPNLLLMDEPTTHLDIGSIDALIGALKMFSGTVVFISHDVYFIRALANHVIHVKSGQLHHYSGGYQYYLDKTAAVSERAALTAGDAPVKTKPVQKEKTGGISKEQRRREAEERQTRARHLREQKQLVEKLEKSIADYERQLQELADELEKPETYNTAGRAMHLNREVLGAQSELDVATKEWEAAVSALAALEAAIPEPAT